MLSDLKTISKTEDTGELLRGNYDSTQNLGVWEKMSGKISFSSTEVESAHAPRNLESSN